MQAADPGEISLPYSGCLLLPDLPPGCQGHEGKDPQGRTGGCRQFPPVEASRDLVQEGLEPGLELLLALAGLDMLGHLEPAVKGCLVEGFIPDQGITGEGRQACPAGLDQGLEVAAVPVVGIGGVVIMPCPAGEQGIGKGQVQLAKGLLLEDPGPVAEVIQVITDGLQGDDGPQELPAVMVRPDGVNASSLAVEFL